MNIPLKSKVEIAKMRAAGRVVADALALISESIRPGVTSTLDIDILAESFLLERGAIPSFKGYRGFPKVVCVSVNEQVVHGIPGPRVLKDGDIVGIDIGAIVGGYHGDSALTLAVGNVSADALALMDATRGSLFAAIAAAGPGKCLGDVSSAIQIYVEDRGYSVVRELMGHGIGTKMHEDPHVPNFGKPGTGPVLQSGMVLAIEPMVNAGGHKINTLDDGWTVVTRDGSLSAHFEHTVAITEDGAEILTMRDGEVPPVL